MSRYLNIGKLVIFIPSILLIFLLFLACTRVQVNAQTQPPEAAVQGIADADKQSVDAFIDKFQQLYSSRDIEGVKALFMSGGAVVIDYAGKVKRYTTREWLELTENIFDENDSLSDRLTEREIDVYRNVAVVRCRYAFDSESEHSSGHDIFSLVRHGDSWLIVSLMYTGDRR